MKKSDIQEWTVEQLMSEQKKMSISYDGDSKDGMWQLYSVWERKNGVDNIQTVKVKKADVIKLLYTSDIADRDNKIQSAIQLVSDTLDKYTENTDEHKHIRNVARQFLQILTGDKVDLEKI